MSRGESDKLAYILAQESFFLDLSFSLSRVYLLFAKQFVCFFEIDVHMHKSQQRTFPGVALSMSLRVQYPRVPFDPSKAIILSVRIGGWTYLKKRVNTSDRKSCWHIAILHGYLVERLTHVYFCKLHRAIRKVSSTISIIYKAFFCSTTKKFIGFHGTLSSPCQIYVYKHVWIIIEKIQLLRAK